MPYWRLYYHVVWATSRRHPWLVGEAAAICEAAFRSHLHRIGAPVHAVAVMPEHVHIACSIPPAIALADAIGQMKGRSSYLVRQRLPELEEQGLSWQHEYSVMSFTEKTLPTVVAYITNQETHHRDGTLHRGLEPD